MQSKSVAPFYVGQEVVCIDNGYRKNALGHGSDAPELKRGKVYTVKNILHPIREEFGVVLSEVKSVHPTGAFLHTRFAPIITNFQHIEYSAVLEKEKELIGCN